MLTVTPPLAAVRAFKPVLPFSGRSSELSGIWLSIRERNYGRSALNLPYSLNRCKVGHMLVWDVVKRDAAIVAALVHLIFQIS
jgi:hypothetical protein